MAKPTRTKYGKRAGTIPAFRVYGDQGLGLKLVYHPHLRTDRFSRIVANETVRMLQKTGTFKRLVITRISPFGDSPGSEA